MSQFGFFLADVKRMVGRRKLRLVHIWLSRAFWGILSYRLERGLYLMIPGIYGILRVPLIPLFNLLEMYSNIEIHYQADIQGGLAILHPAMGVVISSEAVIGKNLTLTGGNVIGIKAYYHEERFIIGDNCNFGANATLIGPLILGHHTSIGASACVVHDCVSDHCILVGVPAKPIH